MLGLVRIYLLCLSTIWLYMRSIGIGNTTYLKATDWLGTVLTAAFGILSLGYLSDFRLLDISFIMRVEMGAGTRLKDEEKQQLGKQDC